MATITFNLPDPALPRLVDAICAKFGYRSTLEGGAPNPETRGQFALRIVRETMKGWVKEYEATNAAQNAASSARAAAEASVDADIAIT